MSQFVARVSVPTFSRLLACCFLLLPVCLYAATTKTYQDPLYCGHQLSCQVATVSNASGGSSGISCVDTYTGCYPGASTGLGTSKPFTCSGVLCTPPVISSLSFTSSTYAHPNQICGLVSGQQHCWNTTTMVTYLGQCDGSGNFCGDIDHDGTLDTSDKFPTNAAAIVDFDDDGMPDTWLQPNLFSCAADAVTCNGLVLDTDDDNDGVLDANDNCPFYADTHQDDDDLDGIGNGCDSDGPGKIDSGFNAGNAINGNVYTIAAQADGKLIFGGSFTAYAGIAINRIARLNADGSLDASFNPGTGANNYINDVAIQNDGKIVIVGAFTTVNGVINNRIARLNSDGSLDAGFNSGSGSSDAIIKVAVQADGKILIILGAGNSYNGTAINRLARLNADGSLDASFNSGSGPDWSIEKIVVQSNGKILIAGSFVTYNGEASNRIARLNSDGSLDASFNSGIGAYPINDVAIQLDGKILIAGDFTSYNGTSITRVARLNTNGSLDVSFNPGSGLDRKVFTIAAQSDGKIVIGGWFDYAVNGVVRSNIARLNTDGSVDLSFNPGSGAGSDYNTAVSQAIIQRDGKIMLLGLLFSKYNGTTVSNWARIHTGDADNDGIENAADNCPTTSNANQLNSDGDSEGNTCDNDDDNDGVADASDAFPLDAFEFVDTDGDGIGDNADTTPNGDTDGDGVDNLTDNCVSVSNANQLDTDSDGAGDACDATPNGDTDGDGVDNLSDNCVPVSNANQLDTDNDGAGDLCDLFPDDALLLLEQNGTAKNEQLASSVAMADMNDDGVVDVLVGVLLADVLVDGKILKKAGVIRLVSGKDNAVLRTLDGTAANQQFGTAMAVANDQNSDGVPDIVVGEPLADRVVLVSGSDGALLGVLAEGDQAGARFGAAVALGDMNGDTGVDLIVGAPLADAGMKDSGEVTVFNGLGTAVLYKRGGEQAGEQFGAAVATDDANRLFVGAPLRDMVVAENNRIIKRVDAGRVVVFPGQGTAPFALLRLGGAAAGDRFGAAISATHGRWAVGAPLADSTGKDAGRVQVFAGMGSLPVATINGSHAGDRFGSAVALQGDMNQDGIQDVAVGAAAFDVSTSVGKRKSAGVKTVLLKDTGRVEVLSGAAL